MDLPLALFRLTNVESGFWGTSMQIPENEYKNMLFFFLVVPSLFLSVCQH